MSLSISALQERAYRQSADKGFHDNEPAEGRALLSLNAERIALIHSELSEALEELRNGKGGNETYYVDLPLPASLVAEAGVERARELIERDNAGKLRKPEGVPSEMADAVIRIGDYCEANGINLEAAILEKLEYNASRAPMHGGKKF